MIDADERHACGIGEALGKRHAHHERAHQSGSLGNGDSGELVRRQHPAGKTERGRCLPERGIDHACDHLDVLARGDLGHHAAEPCVKINLGRYLVGKQRAVGIHDGNGGLVA